MQLLSALALLPVATKALGGHGCTTPLRQYCDALHLTQLTPVAPDTPVDGAYPGIQVQFCALHSGLHKDKSKVELLSEGGIARHD